MFERLERFERKRDLGAAEALALLRPVFALAFGAQLALAALVGGAAWFFVPRGDPNPLLGPALLGLGVVHSSVALALGVAAVRAKTRRAALGATLLVAALLAVPAWFLALAAALGSSTFHMALLSALLMLDYALGLLFCTRFARVAADAPTPDDPIAEDPPPNVAAAEAAAASPSGER